MMTYYSRSISVLFKGLDDELPALLKIHVGGGDTLLHLCSNNNE